MSSITVVAVPTKFPTWLSLYLFVAAKTNYSDYNELCCMKTKQDTDAVGTNGCKARPLATVDV